jgi:hypothetical protein
MARVLITFFTDYFHFHLSFKRKKVSFDTWLVLYTAGAGFEQGVLVFEARLIPT